MSEYIKIIPRYRVDILNKNIAQKPKQRNTKKTTEEYKEELKTKNLNVEVLEEYNGANAKILHKYKDCGHEKLVSPSSILQGYGCLICSPKKQGLKKRKSNDDFVKEINLLNSNIKIKNMLYFL